MPLDETVYTSPRTAKSFSCQAVCLQWWTQPSLQTMLCLTDTALPLLSHDLDTTESQSHHVWQTSTQQAKGFSDYSCWCQVSARFSAESWCLQSILCSKEQQKTDTDRKKKMPSSPNKNFGYFFLAKAFMFLAWCLLYGPIIKLWCSYE